LLGLSQTEQHDHLRRFPSSRINNLLGCLSWLQVFQYYIRLTEQVLAGSLESGYTGQGCVYDVGWALEVEGVADRTYICSGHV